MYIDYFTIVVADYDAGIDFFTRKVGFELVEDLPATTNDGRPTRWVVVRPPGGGTGILLARETDADRPPQLQRVGFFLRVEDFDGAYTAMKSKGVEFVTAPRHEGYGSVVVFLDVAGNRWDLLGPSPKIIG